jgi:hypothetical protein
MTQMPAAFLSYAHFDNAHNHEYLTQFSQLLSNEVRQQTGQEFPIFQDHNDILWGQNWRDRIEGSLDAATLFIPVITPSFFESAECRREMQRFLQRERQLQRNDLILPVYYVNCPQMDSPAERSTDPLAQSVAERQFADWRDLRFTPFSSPRVRKALAHLATQIRDALQRAGKPALPAAPQMIREPAPTYFVPSAPGEIDEMVYQYMARRYGLGQGSVQVTCTIIKGSPAIVKRIVTVDVYAETGELNTFFFIPESQIADAQRNIDLINIRSLTPGCYVAIKDIMPQAGELTINLVVSPPLTEGQQLVYEMTETLPTRLFVIGSPDDEIEGRKTEADYLAWDIGLPTRHLSMRVDFPEGLQPAVFSGEVRYASARPRYPSSRVQHEEQKHVRRPVLGRAEAGHFSLAWEIDYPMIGLIYMLHWERPLPVR